MRSNGSFVLAVAALAVGLVTVSPWAAAQSSDLTGTWKMETTVDLQSGEVAALGARVAEKQSPDQCYYEGTADIIDDDGALSGSVDLVLFSGPDECPPEMSGMLTGGAESGEEQIFVTGSISGQLGALDFSGTLTPNPGGGGTFDVTQGEFDAASGTWAARLLKTVLEIPTVTAVGLTVMTLLLLGAGYFVLRHTVS